MSFARLLKLLRKVAKFKMDFKGKSFLKLLDFSPAEIACLIDLASELKQKKKAGIPANEKVMLWRFEVIRHH